jgi:hypothetical protein
MSPVESAQVGYESTDLAGGLVLRVAGMILLGAVLVHLCIYVVFGHLLATRDIGPPAKPPANHDERPPPPRFSLGQPPGLQATPRYRVYGRQELRALRDAEDRVLTSYGLVDRAAGIVHIPIELAIQLIVLRGPQLSAQRSPGATEPSSQESAAKAVSP